VDAVSQKSGTEPGEWPDRIRDEAELDDWLTHPRPALIEFIRALPSPLLVLGAGGKMGPTLAVLAKRAADAAGHRLKVIAVSRFSNPLSRQWLEERGVSTLNCDLMGDGLANLPEAANVVYLVGLKFGTQQSPALTWAVNTLIPARVMERYPKARVVALSTGNVYPLMPVTGGGAREEEPLTPLGEYANSAVARERIFEFCSQRQGTRVALLRLNYAVELRYGVLVDIARKVWKGETLDLANGFFNCIWQGDANETILRALNLASAPAAAWNLTGPAVLRVRTVAEQLAALLGVTPKFAGMEGESALLNNSARICAVLGNPPTPLEMVLRWTAEWVKQGGRSLDKPTHFEVRDGRY
jgi:nucleoside-diphosphate-sugar epimerase